MVLLTDIFVSQIQIRLLCNLHTGMPEDLAQGENIHAVHKTPFCIVVSEAVRGDVFIKSRSLKVSLEIALKI